MAEIKEARIEISKTNLPLKESIDGYLEFLVNKDDISFSFTSLRADMQKKFIGKKLDEDYFNMIVTPKTEEIDKSNKELERLLKSWGSKIEFK